MKKSNAVIVSIIILLIGILTALYALRLLIVFLVLLLVLEILSKVLINKLREDFQWLITSKDEFPELSKEDLKKFIKPGYDPELGWIRKPNTRKTEIGKFGITDYHIDKKGARSNPGHEKLAKKISCYGDSFAFCRQVNDNETWEWYLSKITKSNVINFAVGNYGLDQALIRLKREFKKNKTNVVMMGVVPSTIVRVLCVWKHYNEFGNTFGFKPRFVLDKGKLKLIKNFIDSEDKFLKYKKYIPMIRKYDYFYETKFKNEMIEFPYFISILSNPLRNIPLIALVSWYKWFSKKEKKNIGGYPLPTKKIMEINLKLRYWLFRKNIGVKLLEKLVEEFVAYGKKHDFIPVLLWMPQKDDLLLIRKKGNAYYGKFINDLKKKAAVIDLTKHLINRRDLKNIYSDDNKYGGHYSKLGNKLIAKLIFKELKCKRLI